MDSPSSIETTKRRDRSALMFLLQHFIKPLNKVLLRLGEPQPSGSQRLHAPKKTKARCDVLERKVGDIYVYELRPKASSSRSATKESPTATDLYYFCGGGWRMPPSSQHWALCTKLAHKLPDHTVSIVSYPFAPHSPAPVAFPQLLDAYKRLLHDSTDAGKQVVLAGDSSGGNIVLCVTLAALAEEEGESITAPSASTPHPAALMAICPSTDLRKENPDMEKVAPHDPILRIPFVKATAKGWCGDWDASDPRVTPLLADASLLQRHNVACHGVTAGYDILGPDALLFRERCLKAGVRGQWLEWDKQMHVFPLVATYGFREGVEGLDWICEVLTDG